jgi:sigma-B regulation protein RsbU (phosphoserine phosphatase)
MAHVAAVMQIRTGVAVALLALGTVTTLGWGESLIGDGRPLGVPAEIVFRLAIGLALTVLMTRQIAAVKRLRLEEADAARMREELAFARGTQEGFLPRSLPAVPGIDLWGVNVSSNEVSGDYYDIRDGGGARPLVLAIADVSGKGVPAALLMSAVQAGLHSHLLRGALDLEQTMQNLNRLVHQDAQPGRFVTMVLAEMDKTARTLRYVRAGHDLPIVVSRDGAVRRLVEGDIVLGLLPDAEFRAASIALSPGDTLCLYTDGVTDAAAPNGDMFDEERLVQVLVRHRAEPAAAIGRAILDAVRAHSGLLRQADDATLVIVKIAGDPAERAEALPAPSSAAVLV